MANFQQIQEAIKTCYELYRDTMLYWDSAFLSDKQQRQEGLIKTFKTLDQEIKTLAETDPAGARLLQSYFNLVFSSGTDFVIKLDSLTGATAGTALKVAAMRSDYMAKAQEPIPEVTGIERLRFFEADLRNDIDKKILLIQRLIENGSFGVTYGLFRNTELSNLQKYQQDLAGIKTLLEDMRSPWKTEGEVTAELLAEHYNSHSFKHLMRSIAETEHFFSHQVVPVITKQTGNNLLLLHAPRSSSKAQNDFRAAINHDEILSIDTLCQGLTEIGQEGLATKLHNENDYNQGLNDALGVFMNVKDNHEVFARGILADLDPDLGLLSEKSDAYYSGYYTAALVHAFPDLFRINHDGNIAYQAQASSLIAQLEPALGLSMTQKIIHPKNFDMAALNQLQTTSPEMPIWQLLKTSIPVSETRSMASKLDDYHQLASLVNKPGKKENQSAFPISSKINDGLDTRKKLTRPLIDRIMYLSQKGIKDNLLSYEEFSRLFGEKLNELINSTHATRKIDLVDVRSKLFQELITKGNLLYETLNRGEASKISYQEAIEAAFKDLQATKPEILQALGENLHHGIKADYTPPVRQAMLPREELEITSALPTEEPLMSAEETMQKLQVDGLQCLKINQNIQDALNICYPQTNTGSRTLKRTLLSKIQEIKVIFDNIRDPILKQKMQEIILTAFGPDIDSNNAFLRQIKQQHSVEELMQYHVYLQHFKQDIQPAPMLAVGIPKLYIEQVLLLEEIFLNKIKSLNVAKKQGIIKNLKDFQTLSPISGVFKQVFMREAPFANNLISFVNSKNLADFLSKLPIEKHNEIIENLKSYAEVDGLQQAIRNQVDILNERLGAMSVEGQIAPSRFTPAGLLVTLNEVGNVNLSYKIGAIKALEEKLSITDANVAAHLHALMSSREDRAAKGAAYVAVLKDIAEGRLQILKEGDALTQARFFAGRMAVMMQDDLISFTPAQKEEIVKGVKSGSAGAGLKAMQSMFGTKSKELSLAKYFALESPPADSNREIRERYIGDFSQDLSLFAPQHATLDYPIFATSMATSSPSATDMEEMVEAIIEAPTTKLGYLGDEKILGYLFDEEGNVVINEAEEPILIEGFELDAETALPKLKEDWEYNEATGEAQPKLLEPDLPPPPVPPRPGYLNGEKIRGFQFNEEGDLLIDGENPVLLKGFELNPETHLPTLMEKWEYDEGTGQAKQIRGYRFDGETGKVLTNEDGSFMLIVGWRQGPGGHLIPPPPPPPPLPPSSNVAKTTLNDESLIPPPPPPPPAGNRGSLLDHSGVLNAIREGGTRIAKASLKTTTPADEFVKTIRLNKSEFIRNKGQTNSESLINQLEERLRKETNRYTILQLELKLAVLKGHDLSALKEAWLEAYQELQELKGSGNREAVSNLNALENGNLEQTSGGLFDATAQAMAKRRQFLTEESESESESDFSDSEEEQKPQLRGKGTGNRDA